MWKILLLQLRRLQFNIRKFVRSISYFSEKIPVKPVPVINNFFIPDSDIVIATAWPTAYDVAKLSPKKGRKYYFVQDYEIWGKNIKETEDSYRLPLNILTISPWLTDLMKSKFNRHDVKEIQNGIRLDKFYPQTAKSFDCASILLMSHSLPTKGSKDAIDALSIVKQRYPQLKINMFGMDNQPDAPFQFEYHRNPQYEKLLSLYQNATIFIFPSRREGWGLTPIEAMSCKCAVIATNVGCIPVINNGKNLILAQTENPTSIAEGVITLLNDKNFAEKTAHEGWVSVQGLDWTKQAHKLEEYLFYNLSKKA
ncbi:MAG: glycosyltransferase family 4 protein [Chitinispirillales bacterium]|nr:glycosyltransferase family 4 protein [Chitinispirillales bacterium]